MRQKKFTVAESFINPNTNMIFQDFTVNTTETVEYKQINKLLTKLYLLFECKNYFDFVSIYTKFNLYILVEILQSFRKNFFDLTNIEIGRYNSLPTFAFDSVLNISSSEFEKIQNNDVNIFFRKGITKNLSIVNIDHLKNFQNKETLVFIDINNIFSLMAILKSYIPIGGFEIIPLSNCKNLNWLTIETEEDVGYFLEVDLYYPDNLHSKHSDFPLAPELFKVNFKNLSDLSQNIFNVCSKSKKYYTNKCLLTFHDRKKYVIHFKLLKFYLHLGMQLTKIHKIIKFNQKPCLKNAIENINLKLQNCKNQFKKNQYEIFFNNLFKNTIQEKNRETHIKIDTNKKQFLQDSFSKMFKSCKLIENNCIKSEHLVAFSLNEINPLFYLGFTFLELQKLYLYDLYYNKLMQFNSFNNKINLISINPQLLCLKIVKFNQLKKIKRNFINLNLNSSRRNGNALKSVTIFNLKNEKYLTKSKFFKDRRKNIRNTKYKYKNHSLKHFFDCYGYNSKDLSSNFNMTKWIFDCNLHSVPYGSIFIKTHFNKCPTCN